MEVLTLPFSLTSSPNLFLDYQEVKSCIQEKREKKEQKEGKGLIWGNLKEEKCMHILFTEETEYTSFMDLCLKEC